MEKHTESEQCSINDLTEDEQQALRDALRDAEMPGVPEVSKIGILTRKGSEIVVEICSLLHGYKFGDAILLKTKDGYTFHSFKWL